jgi:hypothetical protein
MRPLGYLGVEERVISEVILKKVYVKVWTEFSYYRLGFYECGDEPFSSIKAIIIKISRQTLNL